MLKTIAHALDPNPTAISILKEDHRKVEALFEEFEAAQNKRTQASIAQKICNELELHTQLEETTFYPAVKKVSEEVESEVNEGIVEHAAVKRLIKEIKTMSPDDELFEAKVTVVIEYVKHHVREEENDMFPKIVESDLDLTVLGERLLQAKQGLAAASRAPSARRAPARKAKARRSAAKPRARAAGRNGRRPAASASRARSHGGASASA